MDAAAFQPAPWLVQTKFHPPHERTGLIQRSPLDERFTAAVRSHPVTLVTAPAGYGKTSLLASLPRLLPDLPVAWISLDGDDNDPAQFLLSLINALQQLHPGFGKVAWRLARSGRANPSATIGAVINEVLARLPEPFLLALDDLHLMTHPEVVRALAFLLDRIPPQMHLVLGTRQDPPISLARLVARGQLAEFTRSHLRFARPEMDQLLNAALGLNLSPQDLAALDAKVEGWPAGLWLVAHSFGRSDRPNGRREALRHVEDRHLFAFLADEVFGSLEPSFRQFLMQTSILVELTPSACQAVTGEQQAHLMLDQLYMRNLFIEQVAHPPGDEPAYRYHALFGDFLRQQLARELPDQQAELHGRAAAVVKNPIQRMAHLVAAGLWEPAAQSIEQVGHQLLNEGLQKRVQRWIVDLPAEVCDAYPRLLVLAGRCAIVEGDYPGALALLRRGWKAATAIGDAALEGEAISTLISAAAVQGSFTQALAFADEVGDRPVPPAGRAQIQGIRAYGALIAGDWDRATAHLNQAMAVPGETGDPTATLLSTLYLSPLFAALPGALDRMERFCTQVSAGLSDSDGPMHVALHEQMAFIHLWRGRFDQVVAMGEAVTAATSAMDSHLYLGPDTAMYLATVHAARGQYEAAQPYAEVLLQRAERDGGPHLPLWLYTAGRTYWMMGDLVTAKAIYERLCQPLAGDQFPLVPVIRGAFAGLLALAEGRLADAARRLTQAAEQERAIPITAAAGSARLILARLYLEQKRTHDAVELFRQVLAESEALNAPGLILREGTIMLPVLRQAAAQGVAPASMSRLLSLLGLDEEPVTHTDSQPLLDPLTQREMDVLALVVAGASNREIAAALVITEETVKTHVARILRKLDVATRARAAVRARELGLFS